MDKHVFAGDYIMPPGKTLAETLEKGVYACRTPYV